MLVSLNLSAAFDTVDWLALLLETLSSLAYQDHSLLVLFLPYWLLFLLTPSEARSPTLNLSPGPLSIYTRYLDDLIQSQGFNYLNLASSLTPDPLSNCYSTPPLEYLWSISNLTKGAFLPQTCIFWNPPVIQSKKLVSSLDSSLFYMPLMSMPQSTNQQILMTWSSKYIQKASTTPLSWKDHHHFTSITAVISWLISLLPPLPFY